MNDYSQLLVGTVPLLIVIFGLVEFVKSLGLTGRWLTVTSLLLGLVFGIAYRISADGTPVGFGPWFTVVIFGISLGLIASGFYDFANDRFPSKANQPAYDDVGAKMVANTVP
jgi:hypothetical protein